MYGKRKYIIRRCAREKQERGMGDYAKSSDRRGKRKHVSEEIGGKRQCKKEELKRLRNEEVQCAQRGMECRKWKS